MSFNEGKACDAVIRYLEATIGAERSDVRCPENEGHPDPVELTFRLADQFYAVEHTGIEPFDGQIQFGVQSKALFDPVIDQLSAVLPRTEWYDLHVPVDATAGLARRNFPVIQQQIIEWVMATAPTLPLSRAGRLESPHRNVLIAGIPFKMSLYRIERAIPPGQPIFLKHLVGADRGEGARLERIEAGYKKKIGKLTEWKRKTGARTVLILEDDDIQLTNPMVVAQAILDVVARAAHRPDAIYQVTSCVDPWWVSPLLVDDRSFMELGDYEWAWEVDPNSLISLTGR